MVKRGENRGTTETSTPSAPSETVTAVAETPVAEVSAADVPVNYTMFRHNNGLHPDGRASYTIPGVKGNMVIFPTLLADGKFPETLELYSNGQPVKLALPVVKVDRAEEAARKLQEKADKAAAKLAESTARAQEKAKKAEEALAAAKARVEAAAKKTAEVVSI